MTHFKFNKAYLWALLTVFIVSCSSEDSESPTPDVPARGRLLSSSANGGMEVAQLKGIAALFGSEVSAVINPQYGVDLFLIEYETPDIDGNLIKATGLLAAPKGAPAAPLVVYCHGTVLQKNAVPSGLSGEYQIGLLYASEGYAVIMPDYLGMGGSAPTHPYMHAKTEASASIDMLRASKTALANLNVTMSDKLFVTGYSQGGHAAAATSRELEQNFATEFPLTASAPLAAPFDLSGIQVEILLADAPYTTSAFVPYVLYSYNPIYKLTGNTADFFKPAYQSIIAPYFTESQPFSLADLNSKLPEIPNKILDETLLAAVRSDANHPLRLALKDNDLTAWVPKVPVFMCHCDGDKTIPQLHSQNALAVYKAAGVDAQLQNPAPGATHGACALPSLLAVKLWFDTMR